MTGRCRILVNAVVRASAPLPVSCWGAGRHPKGRNVVEQPRTARLDAAVGGAAPHGDVIHHVPALTFHSRSFPRRPPAYVLSALGTPFTSIRVCRKISPSWVANRFGMWKVQSGRSPIKRGVGAGRSAQRGTSGAATGPRGARSAPPNPETDMGRSAPDPELAARNHF